MNKKLKVVWICHFSNKEVQKKLGLIKNVDEFSPWISIGIEEAKKRDDIELHIVSPHRWLKGSKQFSEGNVHYHFFNSGIPFWGRHWPGFLKLDHYTNFFQNKFLTRKIVNRIKPDIINLHGVENEYYSSAIFQFYNKYPILITIQGFFTRQIPSGKIGKFLQKRIDTEIEILKTGKNFGVRCEYMQNIIKEYNAKANMVWHEYFVNVSNKYRNNSSSFEKKYDLIFFSRVTKEKGIEDVIKVTGQLKKIVPEIRVVIIGGVSPKYLIYLKELANKNGCADNIEFKGFLPSQEDIYEQLVKSKVLILPTYNDIIPGAIVESMLHKIPVVTYATGGIPEVNKTGKNILIAGKGDIDGLTKHIQQLLTDEKYYHQMAENGFNYATARWQNEKALEDIMIGYKNVINAFKN